MTIAEIAPWIAIAITLILSILIPLFTQLANNKFQLKMKKMEIELANKETKSKAYEEYFQKVGNLVIYGNNSDFPNAGSAIQRLYAFLPEEEWEQLDKLFSAIRDEKLEIAKGYMEHISKWIAKDLSE